MFLLSQSGQELVLVGEEKIGESRGGDNRDAVAPREPVLKIVDGPALHIDREGAVQ